MNKINSPLNIKIAFLFVVFCNAVVDVAHKVLLQNIAFKVFDGSTQVIWISIINALIIIPFLLLFTVSGYLSDKYNKKNMKIKQGEVFMFSIIAAILGWTLYKDFNFDTNTFEKPALAAVYGIALLMSVIFIVKNFVNKSSNQE